MSSQHFIDKHLNNRTALSYLLYPISALYGIVLRTRRAIFQDKGWQAPVKVISVGNIVSGGTGKTPFTIFLAKLLSSKGLKVAVSHRDYKGEFENLVTIISNREEVLEKAEKACDEASLIANSLPGIPVVAGRNRKNAIMTLLKSFPNLDYVILDDSFQHLKVKHDIDFVLFKQPSPLGNGFTLPAGILREPISAIKYADYVVLTGDGTVPNVVQKYDKPIITGKHVSTGIRDKHGDIIDIPQFADSKVALISGLGNPASFEKSVIDADINFETHFIYPDHYDYKDENVINKIMKELHANHIDYLLTTEKDFTKLKRYSDLPLIVLGIEFKPIVTTILDNKF